MVLHVENSEHALALLASYMYNVQWLYIVINLVQLYMIFTSMLHELYMRHVKFM